MKTLYLHVGPHKTGSTTIQHFLDKNREQLRQYDYAYLNQGSSNGYEMARETGAFLTVGELVRSSSQNNHIFSCEGLEKRKSGFIRQFSRAFPEIRIIAVFYFRRQDQWIESHYNQRVKRGAECRPFADFCKEILALGRIDYLRIIQNWENALGRDAIVLRSLHNLSGSLESDFLEAIGLGWIDGLERVGQLNRSVPADALLAVRTMTRSLSPEVVGLHRFSNLLARYLLKEIPSARFPVDRGFMTRNSSRNILDHYTGQWAELERRYRDDVPLFSCPPQPVDQAIVDDEMPVDGLLLEASFRVTERVFRSLAAELVEADSRGERLALVERYGFPGHS